MMYCPANYNLPNEANKTSELPCEVSKLNSNLPLVPTRSLIEN